jgi:hypothetical protein
MSSPLSGRWIGTIQGTNTGAVFVQFAENNGRVSGLVHIFDPKLGLGVYVISTGDLDLNDIRLVLTPTTQTQMAGHGVVTVLAHLVGPAEIVGEWRSSIGTSGGLLARKITSEPPSIPSSNKKRVAVSKRTKVFISYSHRDNDWLDRLRVHLKPLERDYALDIWDDTQIQAGTIWLEEIEKAIQSTKVALLIVTADFIASDFIADNELPRLLKAAKNDGAVIMSLIVSPSRFRSTSLSQFQAINDPSRPLINLPRGEQEEILVRVSEELEAVFGKT